MAFERRVEPEWLDALPADHPDAIHSRSDLRRLNVWMSTVGTMTRLLEAWGGSGQVEHLVDLGTGDGTFLLRVARRLAPRWRGTTVTLVDRVMAVSPATRRGLVELGWEVELVTAEVFAGLARIRPRDRTVVLANLFLHHFDPEPLRALLATVAGRASGLVACEPRRSRFTLGASRLVGLIGCNAVTRHDAVASVCAGFRGREISQLWPDKGRWSIDEGSAGPFTHFFAARRGQAAG